MSKHRRQSGLFSVSVLVALLALCPRVKAEDDVFRKGAMQAGVSWGVGFGTDDFGGRHTHDLALATGHIGWVLTDVAAADTWLRGTFEVVTEVFGGWQFHPNDRCLFGVTPLLRYNFLTNSRLIPFAEAGAGITYTDIGRPDLSTRFQFNDQGGAGAHCFLRRDMALTVGYRFMHLSNAGIKEPNLGVNTHIFKLGMTWFF